MEKDHCEGHSGTLALLQEHSKAIADLYDKHDDTMLLLNEIKLCTATMAMKLDTGFEQSNKNLAQLSDKIEKFQAMRCYTTQKDAQEVCWTVAHLCSLKGGNRPPGIINI